MKSVFKYIKDLFKPKFKASKKDELILKNGGFDNKDTDENYKVPEVTSNSDVFLLIYNEVTLLAKSYSYFNLPYVNFEELEGFSLLLNKEAEFRESFLNYLIDIVKNEPLYGAHIEKLFKVRLFGSVLNTKIKFTNKNLGQFFLFWQSEDPHSLHIPSHIIMREITMRSKKRSIDDKLITILEKYVRELDIGYYNTFRNQLEKTQRILTDYKFEKQTIPFFLIEDYFGKEVNKILLSLENDKGELVSEILQITGTKRKIASQKQKLEKAIEALGYDFFIEVCIQILAITSTFKNKMAIRHFWAGHPKRYIQKKYYFGMFNENLMIVYGLIQIIQTKTLIEKIPIDSIVLITKRSYTLKQELRLSKSATKLGDLCIEFLYTNYGEKGREKLEEIYKAVPYKNVRKAIDNYLPSVD